MDEFYRPLPPNVQMRNGWPNGALDDFFMAKTAAQSRADNPRKRSGSESEHHKDHKQPIRKSRFSSIKTH